MFLSSALLLSQIPLEPAPPAEPRATISQEEQRKEEAEDEPEDLSSDFDSEDLPPPYRPDPEQKKKRARLGLRFESGYSLMYVHDEGGTHAPAFGIEILRVRGVSESGFYMHHNQLEDTFLTPTLINYGVVQRFRLSRHLAIGAYADLILPFVMGAVCGDAADACMEIWADATDTALPFTLGVAVETPFDAGPISLRPFLRGRHFFSPLPFAFPGATQVTSLEAGLGLQF